MVDSKRLVYVVAFLATALSSCSDDRRPINYTEKSKAEKTEKTTKQQYTNNIRLPITIDFSDHDLIGEQKWQDYDETYRNNPRLFDKIDSTE